MWARLSVDRHVQSSHPVMIAKNNLLPNKPDRLKIGIPTDFAAMKHIRSHNCGKRKKKEFFVMYPGFIGLL